MAQCCCCHGNRRAKGGGGEGWVLREARKRQKKEEEGRKRGLEGGRVLLERHSLAIFGCRDMERREEARFHPTAQIEPPPCSSGAQESLPVLVLPLEQCLYSCSHVPRLFGASHPAAQSLLCARVHIRRVVFRALFINLLQSHLFPRGHVPRHLWPDVTDKTRKCRDT